MRVSLRLRFITLWIFRQYIHHCLFGFIKGFTYSGNLFVEYGIPYMYIPLHLCKWLSIMLTWLHIESANMKAREYYMQVPEDTNVPLQC